MKDKDKYLIFFYPSRVLGGAELLFIRLAESAISRGLRVGYVDYVDGYARSYASNKIEFIEYREKQLILDEEAVIVTPVSNFYKLEEDLVRIHPLSRFNFWCIHSQNVMHVLPYGVELSLLSNREVFEFYRKRMQSVRLKVRRILEAMHDFKALHFMDLHNYDYNRLLLGLGLEEPSYIPVFVPEGGVMKDLTKMKSLDKLHLCWVGRLALTDKIPALLSILDDLNRLDNSDRIILHIIGDGDGRELLQQELAKMGLAVKIIMVGTLSPDILWGYLEEHADVLLGMGTSALEGAKRGIPTIIPNGMQRRGVKDQYRWLYDFKGYDVGCINEPTLEMDVPKGRNLQGMITHLFDRDCYVKVATRCYEHYASLHKERVVTHLFFEKIFDSSLTSTLWAQMLRNKNFTEVSFFKRKGNQKILQGLARSNEVK